MGRAAPDIPDELGAARGYGQCGGAYQKERFVWWPTDKEPTGAVQAHQAQLSCVAGNPEKVAAPVSRTVS